LRGYVSRQYLLWLLTLLQEAAEKEVVAKEAEEKASVKGKVTTYPLVISDIVTYTRIFSSRESLRLTKKRLLNTNASSTWPFRNAVRLNWQSATSIRSLQRSKMSLMTAVKSADSLLCPPCDADIRPGERKGEATSGRRGQEKPEFRGTCQEYLRLSPHPATSSGEPPPILPHAAATTRAQGLERQAF